MKISTDNGAIRNALGDLEALRLIAEAGFDGIDYTFYDTALQYDVLKLSDKERRTMALRIRELAEKYGIAFPQAHAPYAYKYGEDYSQEHYQEVLRSMEFASLLGCRQIVIHTLKFPQTEMSEQQSDDINRAFLRSFLPTAEDNNIDIGVENLFQYDYKRHCYYGQHSTAHKMNAFVDSLGDSRFKVCCDLGHAAITGTEPEDFIAGMTADRMTMLHVQDTDYMDDSHTIPYLGKQNWDAITSALANIGYQGYMNLEVLHFYERFPVEMLPSALRLAADVAHRIAEKVEEKRQ